jgi:hypothetical protein
MGECCEGDVGEGEEEVWVIGYRKRTPRGLSWSRGTIFAVSSSQHVSLTRFGTSMLPVSDIDMFC